MKKLWALVPEYPSKWSNSIIFALMPISVIAIGAVAGCSAGGGEVANTNGGDQVYVSEFNHSFKNGTQVECIYVTRHAKDGGVWCR